VSDVRKTIIAVLNYCFEDFVVTECCNGNEAWKEILDNSPDLLISDCSHAGMSLEEIIRRLSNFRQEIPVIVLSAAISACPELDRRLLGFTQVTVLHKPFTVAGVRSEVAITLLAHAAHAKA
jgi:DNA-binding response OmpR family regulator